MLQQEPTVVVLGATGVLGRAITARLAARGARLGLIARTEERLERIADEVGAEFRTTCDLLDTDGIGDAVGQAADALGRLDGLVVATGVAGFGAAVDEDDAVVEALFAINALGPMAAVRAAVPRMSEGASIAVITAVLVDVPTARMAAYSASKAALSTWLQVLRRELRRSRISVLDARPPHLETGLSDRPLAGVAPAMPAGHDIEEVVALIVDGLYDGKRELVADLRNGSLELR